MSEENDVELQDSEAFSPLTENKLLKANILVPNKSSFLSRNEMNTDFFDFTDQDSTDRYSSKEKLELFMNILIPGRQIACLGKTLKAKVGILLFKNILDLGSDLVIIPTFLCLIGDKDTVSIICVLILFVIYFYISRIVKFVNDPIHNAHNYLYNSTGALFINTETTSHRVRYLLLVKRQERYISLSRDLFNFNFLPSYEKNYKAWVEKIKIETEIECKPRNLNIIERLAKCSQIQCIHWLFSTSNSQKSDLFLSNDINKSMSEKIEAYLTIPKRDQIDDGIYGLFLLKISVAKIQYNKLKCVSILFLILIVAIKLSATIIPLYTSTNPGEQQKLSYVMIQHNLWFQILFIYCIFRYHILGLGSVYEEIFSNLNLTHYYNQLKFLANTINIDQENETNYRVEQFDEILEVKNYLIHEVLLLKAGPYENKFTWKGIKLNIFCESTLETWFHTVASMNKLWIRTNTYDEFGLWAYIAYIAIFLALYFTALAYNVQNEFYFANGYLFNFLLLDVCFGASTCIYSFYYGFKLNKYSTSVIDILKNLQEYYIQMDNGMDKFMDVDKIKSKKMKFLFHYFKQELLKNKDSEITDKELIEKGQEKLKMLQEKLQSIIERYENLNSFKFLGILECTIENFYGIIISTAPLIWTAATAYLNKYLHT